MISSPTQQSIPLVRALANTRLAKTARMRRRAFTYGESTPDARLCLEFSTIARATSLISDVYSPRFRPKTMAPSGCTIAAGIQQQLVGTPEYRDTRHRESCLKDVLSSLHQVCRIIMLSGLAGRIGPPRAA
jgi:hypothetical protein